MYIYIYTQWSSWMFGSISSVHYHLRCFQIYLQMTSMERFSAWLRFRSTVCFYPSVTWRDCGLIVHREETPSAQSQSQDLLQSCVSISCRPQQQLRYHSNAVFVFGRTRSLTASQTNHRFAEMGCELQLYCFDYYCSLGVYDSIHPSII